MAMAQQTRRNQNKDQDRGANKDEPTTAIEDKSAAYLVDVIAETLHNVWWSIRIRKGDKLGPRLHDVDSGSGRSKYHPHLIPWSAKTEQERMQDRYQAVKVMAMYRANPRATQRDIEDAIQDALREFRLATKRGALPPHLGDGWRDNRDILDERSRQAVAIRQLLLDFRAKGGWD